MFAAPLISTVLALSVLSAPSPGAEPEPEPTTPATGDPVTGDPLTEAATEALAEVRDLLDDTTTSLLPPVAEPQADLTLELRDLAMLKDELPPALREEAEAYLARPTDGKKDQYGDGYTTDDVFTECSEAVCVHYVTTTADRVPVADADENGVPDYVDFALATVTEVHNRYVAAGYRPPRGDGTRGGNAKPDIYLADVGAKALYGYCSTDEDFPGTGPQDAPAYCVLDNDYARSQFPTNSARDNLRVTAAHEYFHAVQFGYDASEDAWIMEATATWAEDELYDDIDDNVQYLEYGPMAHPRKSMDQFSGLFQYGTWSFFRHVTERFPAAQGGMPTLVRDLWRRLDDARGAPDDYSLQGLKRVLNKRGTSLRDEFARYAAANRMPGRSYEEGKANRYPAAPLGARASLAPGKLTAKPRTFRLDHLSASTIRYTPGKKLRAKNWRLRVSLVMPKRWKGSAAVVTVLPRQGAPRRTVVKLKKNGKKAQRFQFSSRSVKYVEVTLVNASDHLRCDRGTRFSCRGAPRFDGAKATVRARALRA